MAVFCHLVGATTGAEKPDLASFEAFVLALLHEQLVSFPAAILAGEACENPDGYYWSTDTAYNFILPNSPGSMIEMLEEHEEGTAVETLLYDGKDEATFKEALHQIPFGEKDICICFDLVTSSEENRNGYSRSGEGVAIYALTRPFSVRYEARKSSFQHNLTHYVVFYTSVGREILHIKPALKRILERTFGANLLLEESIDW